MTSETVALLAKRHLGQVGLNEFVDWAVLMLEEGYDTEHLRMLSSLGSAPTNTDVDYYFGQTIHELGWVFLPTPHLLRLYARIIAQKIMDGTMTPVAGCHTIYRIYFDLDYPADMQNWLYLDDGLEAGTYQELKGEEWDKAIRQEAQKFLETVDT